MRVLFLITFSCLFVFYSNAQTPGIRWQRWLGGTNLDVPDINIKTTDGNILTFGNTYSNNGNITGQHGSQDVWAVKMNTNGTLLWQKSYGGSANDSIVDAVHKPNGSTVMLINSKSSNGNISSAHGNSDFWVVNIDSNGTGDIYWEASFGGSNVDFGTNIIALSGGGYAVLGSTMSNDGNVTGQHGGRDLWLIRLDNYGNLVWQKAIGGSLNEYNSHAKVIETRDGNLIVASESESSDGNLTVNNGGWDIWVVKILMDGTIGWQKTIGGNDSDLLQDLQEDEDGSLFILANTTSTNLPSFHGTNNSLADIFLIHLSADGNVLQQKCFGSTGDDDCQQMLLENDGIIISGNAGANNGDITGFHGYRDMWIAKINKDLSISWSKALGGSGADGVTIPDYSYLMKSTGLFIKTSDNGYLVTGSTRSTDGDLLTSNRTGPYDFRADAWIIKLGADGAVQWQNAFGSNIDDWIRGTPIEINQDEYIISGYSTYDSAFAGIHGANDYWIFKLAALNTVKGTLFIDNNLNGIKDTGEPFYSNAIVTTQKPGDVVTSIPENGYFKNVVGLGSYQTTPQINIPYYSFSPSSYNHTFSTYFNTDSVSFALQPTPGIQDLTISIVPLAPTRPGFNTSYRIYYKNIGTTTIAAGEISFAKDGKTNFLSAFPAANSTVGDTTKWNYTNLKPMDTASILINLKIQNPPLTNNGDTIKTVATIRPVTNDLTPDNNTAYLKQVLVGSYDPNDKTESNGGLINQTHISNGEYLNYTIRFQNMGTDTAFGVTVRDTLDAKVNPATLEMVAASHRYELLVVDGNKLSWNFNDIKLPYSSINEPASHGYITYRIKPVSTVAVGDTIHNTASIYFDYNLPVKTNNAFTAVKEAIILPLKLITFSGIIKENETILNWSTQREYDFEKFIIERSLNGTRFVTAGEKLSLNERNSISNYKFIDDIQQLSEKVIFYRLKMLDQNGAISYSKTINLKRPNNSTSFEVFPNPATKKGINILLNSSQSGMATVKILGINGQMLWSHSYEVPRGPVTLTLSGLGELPKGLYTLQFTNGEEKFYKQIVFAY